MKRSIRVLLLGAVLFAGMTGCADLIKITMKDVPRIQPEQVVSHLQDPDFAVIDIRLAHSWEQSSNKIKGACREVSDDFPTWKSKYAKDRTIVLYCA
jgi:hypothetical protein